MFLGIGGLRIGGMSKAVSAASAGTTWNPSDKGGSIVLSSGNLVVSAGVASWQMVRGIVSASSGKRYFEFSQDRVDGGNFMPVVGVAKATESLTSYLGAGPAGYGWQPGRSPPIKLNNGAVPGYGNQIAVSDRVGVLLDLDAGTLEFTKNGVSQGVAYTVSAGTYFPAMSIYLQAPAVSGTGYFGTASWLHPPGGGYLAWG